jgi:uncharacterized protein with PIN domain
VNLRTNSAARAGVYRCSAPNGTLADWSREPLPFVGEGFVHTDVVAAYPR